MDIDRILNFSSNAGKAMLQSGGETYRVEETIARICQSFGIDHVDVFATPTAVMASVFVDGKLHSAIKRISSRRVDLNLVHEVNSLSRAISINNLDIELCEKILDEISEDNYYSDLITIFFAGIAAATFSILFGGNVEEFIAAF
ncbi:TPA: threonine/serine exporter family protein, partial [Clostridioides difficile]|nr:threonine/serine exporter family protein [Clostridioides difficile]